MEAKMAKNEIEKKTEISQETTDKAQDVLHQMMVKEMKSRIQDNISGGSPDFLRAIKSMIKNEEDDK